MRRRKFLAGSAAAAGTMLSSKISFSQQSTRCAVVIGVDSCLNLPTLRAAASGASQFAAFLINEGFNVTALIDTADAKGVRKPVERKAIFNSIKAYVDSGTMTQMVIYFAGHGFLCAQSELWFLSGAPLDDGEVVNVVKTVNFAKNSKIKNVTIIADTCRSLASSLEISQLTGTSIFPNGNATASPDRSVDVFYATSPAASALELTVLENAELYEGIYTSTFLDAFKHPDKDMPTKVEDVGLVIPNRNLKQFLYREVSKRAQAKSIKLQQFPQSDVASDVPMYIARLLPDATVSSGTPPKPAPTTRDVAEAELATVLPPALFSPPNTLPKDQIESVANSSGFRRIQFDMGKIYTDSKFILDVGDRGEAPDLSSGTLIRVFGTEVQSAHSNTQVKVRNADRRIKGETTIIVELGELQGASVAVVFADGRGTIVGALRDFVATVNVSEVGISSVSYDPSKSNGNFSEFNFESERLERLRSAVALASQFGVLSFDGTKSERAAKAEAFGDQTRMMKSIDPTFGIYAAYAFESASLLEKVKSVSDFMRRDLRVELFDVALLADELKGDIIRDHENPVPCCPMLTQGWNFIDVRGVDLPEVLRQAQKHLVHSLWTMFGSEGIQIIAKALEDGKLK